MTASTQSRCTCEPHTACLPACVLTRDMATSGTADAGEYEKHDLRLQWPFHMLLADCSGSGKSTLTTRLVALSSRVMTRTPARVLVFYSHMQPAYRELARQAPCPVQLLDEAKHFTEQLTMQPGTLVIVDDMQATHAHLVSPWFTRWAHHYDSSIIHLVQNVFDKDPSHRTISLNATYIVLFKNPRDMSQVSHLDKQVYPGGNGLLTIAYRDATSTSQHPRNLDCTTPCFLMRTFRRHSPMDPPLRPEKRGGRRKAPSPPPPRGGHSLLLLGRA